MKKQEMMDQEVAHITFRKELEKPENEILSSEMAGRIFSDYESSVVLINDNCYKKSDLSLVNVYLKYNYSRPVCLYMAKADYQKWTN